MDVIVYFDRITVLRVIAARLLRELIKPVIKQSSTMPSYNTYGHLIDGDLQTAADIIDDYILNL